jgi:SAM-dependent methyltransferase
VSEEFSKYENFGAYHWRGVNPRHFSVYNPRLVARYELTLRVLRQRGYPQGRLGLDIGCGDGVLLNKMIRERAFVIGLDYTLTGLLLARERLAHQSRQAVLVNASCYDIPYANDSIDFVTLLDVIEHLRHPSDCLAEIYRVLKPGGVLVLTTPQRLPKQGRHSYHHVSEFTASELCQCLSKHFCGTQVFGTHLGWMAAAYANHRGLKPKLFRLVCRLLTIVGLNPFMIITSTPSDQWTGLLGIGLKRHTSRIGNVKVQYG